MSVWKVPTRPPVLEIVAVDGHPTERERRVVAEALEAFVDPARQASTPSLWLRAGRGQGRRLGMYDYRDRFSRDDAWRLSLRFPLGGREYTARTGRGDSR